MWLFRCKYSGNRRYNSCEGWCENLDIIMFMLIVIDHSDNYSDTSGSLWQFKRDERNMNNGNPVAGWALWNVKIAVSLKSLSNFWR